MAKLSILAGATSQSVNVFLQNSSSTAGAGLTGLVFNTSGLTAYYSHTGANATATAITLATLAAVNSAYSSGGFKELDATNMPGTYRLDLPNAAVASAKGQSVIVYIQGAANLAPCVLEVELTATNNQSATAFITGVNSVAPPTNWNLTSIDANGRLDVIKLAGTTQTARDIGASVLVGDKTGFSLSSAGIQAIWDALTSALTTASSIGKLLVDNINATISSRSTYAGADTAGTTTLLSRIASALSISGGAVTVGTNNDKTGYSVTGDLSATMKTSVETAVWDATAAAHNTAGTTGNKLNSAASAGDPWTTALPGAYAAGTAGKILGTNLDTTVSSRGTGTSTVTTGDVLNQVNAALDATNSELTNIPASNGSLRQLIQFIRQYLTFKRSTTATTETLYKANDSTVLGTSTVSNDGTTATHGRVS